MDNGAWSIIGNGRIGVVKHGMLLTTGERVAVKVFTKEANAIHEAQREVAKILSLRHHRNIVALREIAFDEVEGSPMVMELASRSLRWRDY